ncbi:hypothetical protein [Flavobacterium celericrescens]|uniref:NERD domain-containing protein n=1 Tax=Flavobacterium celericrescens TaxID=2709780 RepID=A0ABX0IA88_9FLAO|nr:hypothetical protein [Flavobacterium celericrescens]NHM04089.1 hypothetical protein [Flavobacterium celericrescens]
MAMYGYSERGIINSLLFTIGNDVSLMNEFISLINIPTLFEQGKPKSYDILLEQSFSQFGDADLVIIMHYENNQKSKVLFIEGKVKTYQKKHWSIQKQYEEFNKEGKFKKNTSNLFFQLHLKKLLIDNAEKISNNEVVEEPWYETQRSIGKNDIVKNAFNKVKNCDAYYIGLIPSTQNEINNFVKSNANSDTVTILNSMHFLTWHLVKEFCENKELEAVLLNFKYNEQQIF